MVPKATNIVINYALEYYDFRSKLAADSCSKSVRNKIWPGFGNAATISGAGTHV